MLEHSVEMFFQQTAARDQPPSRVSIRLALQDGRARLRRRRLLGAAGTAVLAGSAALAVALTSAVPASIFDHQSPQTGSYGRLVQGAFDPSYVAVTFGWLPAHTHFDAASTSPGQEWLTTAGPHHGQWTPTANALCHVRKTRPALVCAGGQPYPEPISGHGPAIDGHPSFWLWNGTELAWPYGPHAWAELQYVVNTGSTASVPAVGLRIARSVEFHQHFSVRYASRFGSPPRGWRIIGVSVQRERGVSLATVYQIAKLRTISPQSVHGSITAAKDMPTVETIPQAPAGGCSMSPKWPKQQLTIHGYRFTVARIPGRARNGIPGRLPGRQLCGLNEDGLFVSISENGAHQALTPTGIMYRLQLLGTTKADWVTNPLS